VSDEGWRRLVRHSYRLGARWLARGAPGRPRPGLYRVLVPLEPWRYWELGRVAEEPFAGRVLDVASPKLLASLLQHEGRGAWTAIDLFAREIEDWRRLDPGLDLQVADARRLGFADESFDACVSVSVVEHIAGDGDARAMDEIWRVLRPGGTLHLTTNVASEPGEVWVDRAAWGEGGERREDGRVFFERRYAERDLERRLLGRPWAVTAREYVRQRRDVHGRFFALRPWSFAVGGALRWVCPRNFRPVADAAALPAGEQGVVYLRLRKSTP
jgi:SAM-dependent methyltransferase